MSVSPSSASRVVSFKNFVMRRNYGRHSCANRQFQRNEPEHACDRLRFLGVDSETEFGVQDAY